MAKEIGHDEAPAIITDHAYVPRDEWWSLCKHCGLAEAAHKETTINSLDHIAPRAEPRAHIAYYGDHVTPKAHIAYYSDDNPDD